ncbi:Nad dependent epimerase dehydratase [Colletotrichum higginsianum IMI 349063]|uniref:Nad dependent epimerase dehydratase n=1 Tax=Colletotrichum higginsianum (strain IMI 349063) TaxID=759273 RepID=A0A1B7YGY0_COLHI|nr:Nad dependent epimerase dehydratase [Colletotrichum higginsianum IMI 349063]OBR11265.1 Nad dependent epimerase dehydratase [Colletotrichum higginsianum IMI 349063]
MGQGHSHPRPGTKFRVIGAGMSRTGTKTFAQALATLIGPVHDGGAEGLVGSAEVRKRWLEVMRLAIKKDKTLPEKKRLEWLLAELMEGYSACFFPLHISGKAGMGPFRRLKIYTILQFNSHRNDPRHRVLVEERADGIEPRRLAVATLLRLAAARAEFVRQLLGLLPTSGVGIGILLTSFGQKMGPARREDVRLSPGGQGLSGPRGARDARGVSAPGRAAGAALVLPGPRRLGPAVRDAQAAGACAAVPAQQQARGCQDGRPARDQGRVGGVWHPPRRCVDLRLGCVEARFDGVEQDWGWRTASLVENAFVDAVSHE